MSRQLRWQENCSQKMERDPTDSPSWRPICHEALPPRTVAASCCPDRGLIAGFHGASKGSNGMLPLFQATPCRSNWTERTKGVRPPYATLLMVKILVLQQLYNLADDALEYQLLDRRSFLQFLDLTESSSIPDAKTIWLFGDRLAQAGVGIQIFEQVQQQLQQQGYMARCGQIVDASLVQAPVQRNKRDEADIVKEDTMPLAWKPHKRAQKDVDARWTKKHGKSYFGYKLHASVDKRYQLMRKIAVTHASVADTTVFEPLLDRANSSRDVYADRGYPTAERSSASPSPCISRRRATT